MQNISQVYKRAFQEITGTARLSPLSLSQKAIAAWAIVDDHQSVLDISCLNGYLLQHYLNKHNVRACGLSSDVETVRTVLSEIAQAEIMHGKPYDIPWQDDTFDMVFLTNQPENIKHIPLMLKEIRRVLSPSGQFMMTIPVFPIFHGRSQIVGTKYRYFSKKHREQLLKQMNQYGFKDVSIRYASLGYAVLIAKDPR